MFSEDEDFQSKVITLRNDGIGRLEILGVYPSCTCTKADLSSYSLGFGERAELTVRASNPHSVSSMVTVRIKTNSKYCEDQIVAFELKEATEFRAVPSFINLGTVPRSQISDSKCSISLSGNQIKDLEGVKSDVPGVLVHLSKRLENLSAKVAVQLDLDCPSGPLVCTLNGNFGDGRVISIAHIQLNVVDD
jgi:hypothetical protein